MNYKELMQKSDTDETALDLLAALDIIRSLNQWCNGKGTGLSVDASMEDVLGYVRCQSNFIREMVQIINAKERNKQSEENKLC